MPPEVYQWLVDVRFRSVRTVFAAAIVARIDSRNLVPAVFEGFVWSIYETIDSRTPLKMLFA